MAFSLSVDFYLFQLCTKKFIFLQAAAAAKSLQSCPTLCDPIDSSPSGSPVPGILWARGEQRLRRLDGGLREESHLEEGSTLERLQSASGNFGGPGVHLPSD